MLASSDQADFFASPQAFHDRARRYQGAGINDFIFQQPLIGEDETMQQVFEIAANEIIPNNAMSSPISHSLLALRRQSIVFAIELP
jgi:hypothetical protein